jgi:hypothetical protein
MNMWQTMDSAPKDGTKILVFCRKGPYEGIHIDYWDEEHDGGVWMHTSSFNPAIAWHQLPNPPE